MPPRGTTPSRAVPRAADGPSAAGIPVSVRTRRPSLRGSSDGERPALPGPAASLPEPAGSAGYLSVRIARVCPGEPPAPRETM
jgi:hypothetical protein